MAKIPKADIVEFENKDLVQDLAGAGHTNLALIEKAYDVYLEAPGASIVINGHPSARRRVAELLKDIYTRLEKGWNCGPADIKRMIGQTDKTRQAAAKMSVNITFPRRKAIVPKTPRQETFIKSMGDNTIIFGVGPAGTGKTFLATAYGASMLARGEVSQFIACRPAVEAGEKLGFLPGDLKEKVDPYMQPIWDALNMVLGHDQVERRMESGEIEVAPLAFMRGRTLADAFVLIDEAQNATVSQMKMALTRLGERAKYAVTGDPSQSDLPHGQISGLSHALNILQNIDDIDAVIFEASDVVRHPLVGKIVGAYEKDAKNP
ncbi:MAG: PhoH family protein [Robiginitomaculum sp.]